MEITDLAKRTSKHIRLSQDDWYLTMWNKSILKSKNKQEQLKELHKIILEGGKPIQADHVQNIVVNQGLQQGIDLLIGASSTTIDYASVGTDGTAEAVTQTDLQAEDTGGSYARQQFSVAGIRSRANQTLTLEMLWGDGDVSAVPINLKEAGVHTALTGANNIYSRAVFTTFNLQTDFILYVAITETHQNGVL